MIILRNHILVLVMLSILVITFIVEPVNGFSQHIEYVYDVVGEYTGSLEVRVSGKYKFILTSNKTDTSPAYLHVIYRYSFFLNMKYTEYGAQYLYGYTLENYTVEQEGFTDKFLEQVNKTLEKELGITHICRAVNVNPRILLMVSAGFSKLYFNDFSEYRNISAISLYEDVVSFTFYYYSEVFLDNAIYRVFIVAYYDAISYTPLYFYRYRLITDIYNDTNYLYVKETITNYEIGSQLSRISYSHTKTIVFKDKITGKIGVITYGEYVEPVLKVINDTLLVEIDTDYPYRIILTLNKDTKINYSTIQFKSYKLRTMTIYVSEIITHNTTYILTFNKPIIKIKEQSSNATFVHEITVEEKNYSSSTVLLYTLGFNILAIIIIYRLSKALALILKQLS